MQSSTSFICKTFDVVLVVVGGRGGGVDED